MENIHYVGMDVHKETIQFAVYNSNDRDPILEKETINDLAVIKRFFEGIKSPDGIRSCYEAGCLGYSLHRFLESIGIKNMVVSPGAVPISPRDRSRKNDRYDAQLLGRMLRDQRLTPIYVPTKDDEAVRDFLRFREDLKKEIMHARQRLLGFLMRHHIKYDIGKDHWTDRHHVWLRGLRLEDPMLQLTLKSQVTGLDQLILNKAEADQEVQHIAARPQYAPAVKRLIGLKGVDVLTALSFIVEIGDFKRFSNAPSFMNFLGLVPREHSSGNSHLLGRITKCGNVHLRTLLVEGCWCFRFKSRGSKRLATRRVGLPADLLAYCDKASRHLEGLFRNLVLEKKKSSQIAVVATAREMSGFIWGIMTERTA